MSSKLINVVLDLETLDVAHTAAIIQIGCAIPYFDQQHIPPMLRSKGPVEFNRTISYDSCLYWINKEPVVTQSPHTMQWWEVQPTRKEVFSGQDDYVDVMFDFTQWILSLRAGGADVAIWGNGSDFDNPILTHSLDCFGYHNVWAHKNNRCLRTAKAMFPAPMLERLSDETPHTGIGDARYEARQLDYIYLSNQRQQL